MSDNQNNDTESQDLSARVELPLSIQEKLDSLPTDPGVYQYKDKDGKVVYVGKAKNLRSRVRSYFQSGRPKDAKTQALVRKIADIDVIVTDSAVEALILEDTLIKKLRPRYNVMLRDDKSYPYIRITDEPYPRIFATRTMVRDGSKYFGPYTDVKYVRNLLKTLRSMFPIRSCDWNLNSETIAAGKFKLCLDYHIGRCEGPCEGLVAQVRYGEMIDQVRQVLSGKTRGLERVLETEMGYLSEDMRFEEAAAVRNRLQKLREFSSRQKIVLDEPVDRDIVAFAADDDDACAVILKVRDGKLIGKQHHYFSGVLHLPADQILTKIIERHYLGTEDIPEEVLLPIEPEDDDEVLERFLSDRRGQGRVKMSVPKIGDKQKVVTMAQTNAKFLLDELKLQKMKRSDMIPRPVQSLQRDLNLKNVPRRIECFDNSNFQGTDPVSSMVCFIDGRPRPSEYRKFKVRTVEGSDDFATMKEVVHRRYARVLKDGWALPDLVVIDGGKGQVSAATEAMTELGLEHIPLIGLAKRLEEIVLPGQRDTILLPKSSSGLRLLQHIRDEAHRFAIEFHRSLRHKRTLQTELSQIPGVGPKTVQKMFEIFGSVRGVQTATVEQLQDVLGPRTGQSVWEYFKAKPLEVLDDVAIKPDDVNAGDAGGNSLTEDKLSDEPVDPLGDDIVDEQDDGIGDEFPDEAVEGLDDEFRSEAVDGISDEPRDEAADGLDDEPRDEAVDGLDDDIFHN